MHPLRPVIAAVLLIAVGWTIAGCTSLPREPAVPLELVERAEVPGMHKVRAFGGGEESSLLQGAIEAAEREIAWLASQGDGGPLPTAHYLAISGGGQNGAFGAGLLCGWTAAGTRPEFKLVTGISTGALTAPFAYLGPEYDHVLREVYTTVSTKDIAKKRGLLAALTSDAMADTSPLWTLVRKYVDEDLLAAIAREHAKGRALIIGTTNLDARRPVLWDIGRIASSGDPQALELVRSILIASASIPGAFPPVMIEVEVDGVRYQEMHVDGGAMTQVFVYPSALTAAGIAEAGITRERAAYIIRNARLDAEWSQVERRTLSIAGKSITSMIQSQGVGDLYRIYVVAQRDGVDYNLAFIPPDFKETPAEEFDPGYMTKLFDVGFGLALRGYPWDKTPPYYHGPPRPLLESTARDR